jgi:hypothetical protein
MAFWAATGAILGLGSSIMGGMQQQSAARQANASAEKQAKQQYKRAVKEWEIDYLEKRANWMWDVAKTEATKYVERQKEADYNWRAQKLIDSAMSNLAVNQAALHDRFVTEEDLRAVQVGGEHGYNMNRLASEAGETVRQYMAGIRDSALQSSQAVNQMQREQQEILSSMVFDQQKDQLGWEINQIAALMDSADTQAVASARSGGSGTADRVALNAAQKLGRAWGEMDQRSKAREARVGLMNGAMRGETATQLGRIALSMQDQAQKIQYTNAQYVSNSAYETSKLRDLTIPGFQLAENQYGRELKALQIQTQGVLNEASMPYRQAIFFDPVEPIKGLKPEKYAPTKVYVPSTAGIIGSAIIGGVQGAINLGTYTDPATGTMKWR